MSDEHTAENDADAHLAAVWMRGNGTGYYFTCPRCHFYKNNEPGPCRMIGCGGDRGARRGQRHSARRGERQCLTHLPASRRAA